MKSLESMFSWLTADNDEILPRKLTCKLGPGITLLLETVVVGFAILLTAAVARFYLPLPPQ